jgi:hypothetical protein
MPDFTLLMRWLLFLFFNSFLLRRGHYERSKDIINGMRILNRHENALALKLIDSIGGEQGFVPKEFTLGSGSKL